eukprot:gene4836-8421_t
MRQSLKFLNTSIKNGSSKGMLKPVFISNGTQKYSTFASQEEEDEYHLIKKQREVDLFYYLLGDFENEVVTDRLRLVAESLKTKDDFVDFLKKASAYSAELKYNGSNKVGTMFKKEPIRVAVTGAAGNIGYSLIPRIASGEVFGEDQPVILHLLEVKQAEKALQGVKMEIEDCAFNLVRGIVATSDINAGFKDVDYAFLVGAKPRGPGMERKDLMKDNASIFAVQGKALSDNAKPTCLSVVVGNPANTNALIAASNAPNIPLENFSAMTRLDHDRALAQLSLKLNTHIDQIKDLCIWGNHSLTQVPDVSNATVNGQKVTKLVDGKWLDNEFIPRVQKRGAEIIAARSLSSAASAADAALKHMKDWVQGSDKVVSMAVPSDGSYGVKSGIYCSYPVVCKGKGKYEIVQNLQLDEKTKKRIAESVKELEQEKSDVKDMIKSNRFKK